MYQEWVIPQNSPHTIKTWERGEQIIDGGKKTEIKIDSENLLIQKKKKDIYTVIVKYQQQEKKNSQMKNYKKLSFYTSDLKI